MLDRPPAAHAQTPGSIDPTFNVGTGPDGEVRGLALQTDGKVIVAGFSTWSAPPPRSGIARLNVDGSVDTTFDPGAGIAGDTPNTGVYSVAVQADGKVLVGGVYDTFNGAAHSGIARLNADGSLDAAFNAGIDAGSGVRALVVQADGKIVIGGDFVMVDGVAKQSFARLNADGSLDTDLRRRRVARGRRHLPDRASRPTARSSTAAISAPISFSPLQRVNANGT